jgi:hypothetical protein
MDAHFKAQLRELRKGLAEGSDTLDDTIGAAIVESVADEQANIATALEDAQANRPVHQNGLHMIETHILSEYHVDVELTVNRNLSACGYIDLVGLISHWDRMSVVIQYGNHFIDGKDIKQWEQSGITMGTDITIYTKNLKDDTDAERAQRAAGNMGRYLGYSVTVASVNRHDHYIHRNLFVDFEDKILADESNADAKKVAIAMAAEARKYPGKVYLKASSLGSCIADAKNEVDLLILLLRKKGRMQLAFEPTAGGTTPIYEAIEQIAVGDIPAEYQ